MDKSIPEDAIYNTRTRSKLTKSNMLQHDSQIKYVFKLDDFKLNPRLIKIDVEGAELSVLKGSVEALRYKPIIIFESHNTRQLNKIRAYLRQYDYNEYAKLNDITFMAR